MDSQTAQLSIKIARIGSTVMNDFLKIPVQNGSSPAGSLPRGAAITISGGWKGSITISSSDELSRRIAAAMFRKDDDSVDTRDITDALTELTNIIAGNIKAILPGPSQLSLPVALETVPEANQGSVQVQLEDDKAGHLSICLQPGLH
ncbi:chemotaxis protein CheX [Alcanivorax sp. DP30]|uniref:chemotaxis protein CheX n=1 Tax=Alcanivorax sp. DP30 TaxID=2606217 RepID=UPI00136FA410|nr:chemotaxis protein CheX [Alcanivorax sp. DP30]MZR61398.1 hypothetical protein [Alcanivorax sp. DP30]